MTFTPYTIRITGLDAPPGSIEMAELRALCDAVIEGAARALRLEVEGASIRKGPLPEWLKQAVKIRVGSFQKGSTLVPTSAPPLGETPLFGGDGAAPDDLAPEQTALTFLARAVQDLAEGHTDSDQVDRGMLEALDYFGRIGGPGAEISLSSEVRPGDAFTITPYILATVASLKKQAPRDTTLLVAGRLDAVKAPDRFTMKTGDGRVLNGTLAAPSATDQLRSLWGEQVVAQGTARHTATGRVRFLEATMLRAHEDGDDALLALMKTGSLFPEAPAEPDAQNAWESLRGAWPGDETWEELLAELDGSKQEG